MTWEFQGIGVLRLRIASVLLLTDPAVPERVVPQYRRFYVREGKASMYNRILVPPDGSHTATLRLREARIAGTPRGPSVARSDGERRRRYPDESAVRPPCSCCRNHRDRPHPQQAVLAKTG